MLWLSKGMAGKSCHIGRSRMLRTALETCLWWMKLKDTSPRKSLQETIDTVSGFHLVSRKCSAQSDMKTPDSLQKPMVDYFSMGFHISNTTQSKLWMITIWLAVWNMLYFPINIGNFIIPIDELICFRGVLSTTNQKSMMGNPFSSQAVSTLWPEEFLIARIISPSSSALLFFGRASGSWTGCYWKWPYWVHWFSHWIWRFSIVMSFYQRV